jgi:hypothetical protein
MLVATGQLRGTDAAKPSGAPGLDQQDPSRGVYPRDGSGKDFAELCVASSVGAETGVGSGTHGQCERYDENDESQRASNGKQHRFDRHKFLPNAPGGQGEHAEIYTSLR